MSGLTATGKPSLRESSGASSGRSIEAAHEAVMQAEDSDERVEARIQVGCTLNGAARRLLDDNLNRDSVGSLTGRLPAPVRR